MSKPESMLSFIVPVHEPSAILFDKVLKALCDQSLKEWEAVFVLDGPSDLATKAIERAFKKVPNHYKIVEIPHSGAQRARNTGFIHSQGNYVVFWDSDCVIECHTAKAWVDWLDANPSDGFVYSGYKFLNEQGAINSVPFDPWRLRVRNYISTCFPVRRELVGPGWDESLKSLQDWSFWLGVVERGGVGKFLQGYAFSTAYPTEKSISGLGCTSETWLSRMDAVRALHNIPIKDVCVTSLHDKMDGISLAKAIGADYDDHPNDKPNHYKTIIQVGFSVQPGEFEQCASAWGKQHKKIIFWTANDVEAIYDTISRRAQRRYAGEINKIATQYVEDKAAAELMTDSGFAVTVLPLPVVSKEETVPLPAEPKFLVDCSPTYGHVLNAIQKSIPDIKLEVASGTQKIEDYTGLACFHQDRLLRPSVKRMLAAGRHVVSNVQAPFAGYMDDRVSDGKFIKEFVENIRAAVKKSQSSEQVRYWVDQRRVDRVAEVVK